MDISAQDLETCLGEDMENGDVTDKLSELISRWTRAAWVWSLKFMKIRIQKFRLRQAKRNLDRRTSRLGAEFYSLYRQGETEFLHSLVVLQQLKIVEEAERQVFAIYDRIEFMEKEYAEKIEELRKQK